MSMTDPIADMLTRIRNGQKARMVSVSMPASKAKEAVARVLQEEGYITGYETAGEGASKVLSIDLKYFEGVPVIERIQRALEGVRRGRQLAGLAEIAPLDQVRCELQVLIVLAFLGHGQKAMGNEMGQRRIVRRHGMTVEPEQGTKLQLIVIAQLAEVERALIGLAHLDGAIASRCRQAQPAHGLQLHFQAFALAGLVNLGHQRQRFV